MKKYKSVKPTILDRDKERGKNPNKFAIEKQSMQRLEYSAKEGKHQIYARGRK